MILSRRWQDWVTTVVGLLVGLSSFVFTSGLAGSTSWAESAAICSTVGFGGLIFVVGVLTLIFPSPAWLDIAQVVLAALLFVSPWLIGFTAITALAWTAFAGGVAVAAAAGSRLVQHGPTLTPTA